MKVRALLLFAFMASFTTLPLLAAEGTEKETFNLARDFYNQGEYFHSVTELMRYRHLYPRGTYGAESALLLGKAYMRGNDYGRAVEALRYCSGAYRGKPSGEEALYLLGYMRISQGSPLYGMKNFQDYLTNYGEGTYTERVHLYRSYGAALMGDPTGARELVQLYQTMYPQGAYSAKALELDNALIDEINRPKKSATVALLGSLVLPGFGHFYTENYKTGVLALLSNALFISLIAHGVVTDNTFQWAFFSIIELSFYQYSLYGALRDVAEYNSREPFYKGLRLSIEREF